MTAYDGAGGKSESDVDRCIVITGASTGIGQAAVSACLAAGYQVVATARRQSDLQRLSAQGALAVALELDDPQSVAAAASQIRLLTGGCIHTLFNNAGYGLQVAMEDAGWEALQAQFTTNVVGPLSLTNLLLDCLGAGSRLVFNSSVLGVCVVPFRGPYCMSKFALEAASDAYRLELASRGVGVHVIQPGPIEASFRANAYRALVACLGDRKPRLDYGDHIQRLQATTATEGSLPAAAVAALLVDIIEGRKKRMRYAVTRIARVAVVVKRVLGSAFYHVAKRNQPLRERS